MKAYEGVDVYIHIFLTSALVGEWSTSRSGRFTPCTHWIGGWVNPRAGLDDLENKILHLTGTRTSTSRSSSPQPVAIRVLTTLSRLPKCRYVKEQITTGSATCLYCLCIVNKCSVPLRLNLFRPLENFRSPWTDKVVRHRYRISFPYCICFQNIRTFLVFVLSMLNNSP
jgi:hypothetical protein